MYTAKGACGKVSNIPYLQIASFHRDKSILVVLDGMHLLLKVSCFPIVQAVLCTKYKFGGGWSFQECDKRGQKGHL